MFLIVFIKKKKKKSERILLVNVAVAGQSGRDVRVHDAQNDCDNRRRQGLHERDQLFVLED